MIEDGNELEALTRMIYGESVDDKIKEWIGKEYSTEINNSKIHKTNKEEDAKTA